jgi:hypothetical protein
MATRPILVRFLLRPHLLTCLQPLIAAKNILQCYAFASDVGTCPRLREGAGRANGCCRPKVWSQPLPDVTAVTLSPQTVRIQGEYVP